MTRLVWSPAHFEQRAGVSRKGDSKPPRQSRGYGSLTTEQCAKSQHAHSRCRQSYDQPAWSEHQYDDDTLEQSGEESVQQSALGPLTGPGPKLQTLHDIDGTGFFEAGLENVRWRV